MHHKSRLSLFGDKPNGPSIKTYRMKFMDDGRGSPKEIGFEAQDAATALVIAHEEASNRSAELWCDGRMLCTIKRTARRLGDRLRLKGLKVGHGVAEGAAFKLPGPGAGIAR